MAKGTRGNRSSYPRSKHNSWKEWFKAFAIALGVLILVRFFIIGFTTVSGTGMEQTLLAGDVLLVNKYRYGARMPMRLFPQKLINLFFSTDTLPPVRQLPYWRFPGYEEPGTGHLVLLNIPAPHQIPVDRRTKVVKRLMAAPGDSLSIVGGEVFVNGERIKSLPEMQWNYRVQLRSGANLDTFLISNEIEQGSRTTGRNTYLFPLTVQKAETLKEQNEVLRIKRHNSPVESIFSAPFGIDAQRWTADQFGPVVLPFKGFKIDLTRHNLQKYYYTLLYHERLQLEWRNDSLFIRGRYASTYTFKNDYYFFMGDNRHHTSDSRMWGFVPENHIIGKASMVFMSFDTHAPMVGMIRFNRLFLPVEKISTHEN